MAAEKRPCPKCGETNYATDRQCMSCGASLVGAQPPPPPVPAAPMIGPPVASSGGAFEAVIPVRNGSALAAYYLGLFSLVPFIGVPMGVVAVVLGIKGLQFGKANPGVHGTVHAWVGIICGGFWALVYAFLTVAIVLGAIAGHRSQ